MRGNKKGFTLIEIAIVLTIVGLVIGGIWLAASTVLNNNKKSELERDIIEVVQNTKNLFANQTSVDPADGFAIADARNAGIFPAGMVNGNFVRHPFATTTTQNSVQFDGAGNQITFTIGLGGIAGGRYIPQDACISAATRIATPENFRRYGIVSVNGLTEATATNAATVAASCGNAGGNNPIEIIFTVP